MSQSLRWQAVLPITTPKEEPKKTEPYEPLYEQAESMPLSQDLWETRHMLRHRTSMSLVLLLLG